MRSVHGGLPRGSTEAVLAKVNKAHKSLVRKEVWRQKFDFLLKQVEEEMKEDKVNKVNASHSSSADAGPTSTGNLGTSVAAATGEGRRLSSPACFALPEALARPSSAASSASHVRGGTPGLIPRPRSCSGISAGVPLSRRTSSAISFSAHHSTIESEAEDGQAAAEAWGAPPSSSVRGGWCKTRKGPRLHSRRRCATAGATRNQHSSSERGPVCPPGAALPRMLSGSSSLPLLAMERRARELCGIRDEYYGGNELSMHEDILHCSNPNLFPLRQHSHSKPFPLQSLEAYSADPLIPVIQV